ncbi:hypothetical protein Pfo_023025, partial [Paulownia fortunei]
AQYYGLHSTYSTAVCLTAGDYLFNRHITRTRDWHVEAMSGLTKLRPSPTEPKFSKPTSSAATPSATFPFSGFDIIFRSTHYLSSYFSVNYATIITACAAASLIGATVVPTIIGFAFFLWLILHFLRKNPLTIWCRHVTYWAVSLGLVLDSVAALFVTGPVE